MGRVRLLETWEQSGPSPDAFLVTDDQEPLIDALGNPLVP